MKAQSSSLPKKLIRSALAATVIASIFPAMGAYAQVLYWNPSAGGSGTWDAATASWSANPAGPADTAWAAGTDNTTLARFGGTGGAVSVATTLSSGGLRFDVTDYTLSAASLTVFELNGDRTIHVESGAQATLGSNVRIMATGSASLGFQKTGSGTLVISGPAGTNEAYFGNGVVTANRRLIEISEGTLEIQSQSLNNTQNLVNIAAGATLDLQGGILNIAGVSGAGTIEGNQKLYLRGAGLDFSGVIQGDVGLVRLNSLPAQTLSGSTANTFTGEVEMRVGALVLAKDEGVNAVSGSRIYFRGGTNVAVVRLENNEQIAESTQLWYSVVTTGSITFDLNGYSERMGSLVLDHAGNAGAGQHLIIDFGLNDTAQYLWFSDLQILNPHSSTLYILNYEAGVDSLRFSVDPTAGLSYLSMDGTAASASFDAINNYWVVNPIPEPGGTVLLGMAFLILAMSRHRGRV